jgi:hypothetical protein
LKKAGIPMVLNLMQGVFKNESLRRRNPGAKIQKILIYLPKNSKKLYVIYLKATYVYTKTKTESLLNIPFGSVILSLCI